MVAISVENLGKAYKQYNSHWQRLAEWFLPSKKIRHELKWVLEDINFTVQQGESVGIIGMNGAGKSTLLKIIVGTIKPTNGHVNINGKVTALLELGMGFHPDFTGRQNVIMSGLLLGITEKELISLMPSIEEFAEIGDYIDQPVRVYSSGMQMRLAFSVATIKRPDILIVDEAMSVGDTYFQHKSFERIKQFRKEGTALLLVSHDKAAIQAICDRAILLESGRVIMQGSPEQVMDFYNAKIAEREDDNVLLKVATDGRQQTISGSGEATIEKVSLLNQQLEKIELIEVGQAVILSIDVNINDDIDDLVLGYLIKDRLGQSVFGTNTYRLKQGLNNLHKNEIINYQFDFNLDLGEGSYSIAVALHTADTHLSKNYHWCDLSLVFKMINTNKQDFIGVAWLPPKLRCTRNG